MGKEKNETPPETSYRMAGALSAIKNAVSELIKDTKSLDDKYEGFVKGEYRGTVNEVNGRLKNLENAVNDLPKLLMCHFANCPDFARFRPILSKIANQNMEARSK